MQSDELDTHHPHHSNSVRRNNTSRSDKVGKNVNNISSSSIQHELGGDIGGPAEKAVSSGEVDASAGAAGWSAERVQKVLDIHRMHIREMADIAREEARVVAAYTMQGTNAEEYIAQLREVTERKESAIEAFKKEVGL